MKPTSKQKASAPRGSLVRSVGPEAGPLRVLFALSGLHRVRRGAETAFESIAEHLARRSDVQVTLIGSGPSSAGGRYRYRRARSVGRHAFEAWPKLPMLRSEGMYEELTFAPQLARAYRPSEFDVTVACTFPYTNWVLRRGRGRRPVHVFVTQNGDWPAQSNRSEFRYFGCDGLVCTNNEYYHRNRDRWFCRLIPNGVDPQLFSPGPADRAALGLPDDRPVVLMVSALSETKRVIEGIEAVAELEEAHLVVAGDGPLRSQVQAAGQQHLPGRFDLRSVPRAEMPELYRAADMFLHMSQVEPSANAYMEALATGLPIVTHDREVTRWTFGDQAVLIDTGDASAVVEGLHRALSMRTEEAVNGRRALVEKRFAWSAIADQYLAFFREVRQRAGK